MRTKTGLVAATFALSIASLAMQASADIYLRDGTQKVDVREEGGRLYCTRVSDNFEMCNGMTRNADGTWSGKKMKHPDMPGFMRFNGTVTFRENGLTIRGCALGICQSEDWAEG